MEPTLRTNEGCKSCIPPTLRAYFLVQRTENNKSDGLVLHRNAAEMTIWLFVIRLALPDQNRAGSPRA